MSASNDTPEISLGFVQVIDLGDASLIGGYLLLNHLGRPLEFHCTEPVSPNRAQRILYGATLKSFLGGEQIARTLIEHSKLQPSFVFVDNLSVLAVRGHVAMPVLHVSQENPTQHADGGLSVVHDETVLTADAKHPQDLEQLRMTLPRELKDWDFLEPFERIGEAMRELQKAA